MSSIKYWNGSSWGNTSYFTPKIWNGTAWVSSRNIFVWNGTNWVSKKIATSVVPPGTSFVLTSAISGSPGAPPSCGIVYSGFSNYNLSPVYGALSPATYNTYPILGLRTTTSYVASGSVCIPSSTTFNLVVSSIYSGIQTGLFNQIVFPNLTTIYTAASATFTPASVITGGGVGIGSISIAYPNIWSWTVPTGTTLASGTYSIS